MPEIVPKAIEADIRATVNTLNTNALRNVITTKAIDIEEIGIVDATIVAIVAKGNNCCFS